MVTLIFPQFLDFFCLCNSLLWNVPITYQGIWVVRSIKRPTLDFSSCHDLAVLEFEPTCTLLGILSPHPTPLFLPLLHLWKKKCTDNIPKMLLDPKHSWFGVLVLLWLRHNFVNNCYLSKKLLVKMPNRYQRENTFPSFPAPFPRGDCD